MANRVVYATIEPSIYSTDEGTPTLYFECEVSPAEVQYGFTHFDEHFRTHQGEYPSLDVDTTVLIDHEGWWHAPISIHQWRYQAIGD